MPCNDPFIEDLRSIHCLTEDACAVLNQHLVNDLMDHLPQEGCNTILLFESPYKAEVCKNYPLAGNAGATVAGAFIGTMGDILHSEHFDERAFKRFEKMGIMNVSRLPLQKDAYSGLENLQMDLSGPEGLLCHFRKIKERLEKGSSYNSVQQSVEKTKCAIKNDLKRRVEQLNHLNPCAEVYYVACGNVAKEFFKAACPNITPTCIPHPSSRKHPWFKDGNLDSEVQTVVNRFRPVNADPPSSTS